MVKTIEFIRNRLGERLWLKPLITCAASVGAIGAAYLMDGWFAEDTFPDVTASSLKMLLGVLTSGMLVIATFAVGAMISAYSSASLNATPRAFPVMIADDVSQNALSTFVGAFLFAVIALLVLMNEVFGAPGRFFLLVLTLGVFWIVVMTFIRWVDRIARLGRLQTTVEQVEGAAQRSIKRYHSSWLSEQSEGFEPVKGNHVAEEKIGYLQKIDWPALQGWAEEHDRRIQVRVLPGKFVTPDLTLAIVSEKDDEELSDDEQKRLRSAFHIGKNRVFDEDPRFGFVVLSEIASRALSPAVNDPGTAIQIIGQFVRLVHSWKKWEKEDQPEAQQEFDRLEASPISVGDILEDAFLGIERNGAAYKEVMIRLHKAFHSIGKIDGETEKAVSKHSADALERIRLTMDFEGDRKAVESAAAQ